MNKFDVDTFFDIREVGKGGEGTVFRATIKSFGRVAVKVYHSSSSVNHRELKNIYQFSHHPNIVRLLGFIENANLDGDRFSRRTGYVMEYMSNGSVHDAIHKRKLDYSLDTAYSWICQTSRAVLYLHENNVIHRDLKPRNLLLCDDLKNVKICDFGLTRDCKEESTLTAGIGSLRYMAPEMIRAGSGNKYDKSVDVYSLGITIWEILTKRIPYDHVPHLLTSEFTLCEAVVNGVRPETPADLQWDAQFIIENAWMTKTSARMEIGEIVNFFESKLRKEHNDMEGESSETDDSDPEETITATATALGDASVGPENSVQYVTWLATLLRQSGKSGKSPEIRGNSKSTNVPAMLNMAAGGSKSKTKEGAVLDNSNYSIPVDPETVTAKQTLKNVVTSPSLIACQQDLKEERNTDILARETEQLAMKPSSISDRIRQFESNSDRNPKETKAWEVKASPYTNYTLHAYGNDEGIEYPPNVYVSVAHGRVQENHYLETIAIAPSMGQVDLGFEFQGRLDRSVIGYYWAFFVIKVTSQSAAQKAGLRVGDKIHRVNGKHLEMMDYAEQREFHDVIRNWSYPYPLVLAVKRK